MWLYLYLCVFIIFIAVNLICFCLNILVQFLINKFNYPYYKLVVIISLCFLNVIMILFSWSAYNQL